MIQPTIGLAFLAGLVSFLSPCVFPLVPVYAGYLGGRATVPGETTAANRMPLLVNGVAFVLGFSLVFVVLYYLFSALEVTLFVHHERTFDIVGGVIVVGFALQMLGIVHVPWLAREFRVASSALPGLLGSALLGISFGFGWSPCIGPELGAILTLANGRDFGGLPFMLLYCLGLAVPFLVVAVLADRLRQSLRRLNRHLNLVNMVAGGLLLVFGLLLLTGQITLLSQISPSSPFNL